MLVRLVLWGVIIVLVLDIREVCLEIVIDFKIIVLNWYLFKKLIIFFLLRILCLFFLFLLI